MDYKILLTVFTTVFLAELGDKTQFATMLFAADKDTSKWEVFFAASAALIVAAGIGVLVGSLISNIIEPRTLSYIAGSGFILVGIYTLWSA